MDTRVAIVTGANAGIGLSLVKRLLKETDLHICMVCRNKLKAYQVIRTLNCEFPERIIDLIVCDIAKPQSAIKAASEIKEKYKNISHIFCNAGVMSYPIIDWKYLVKTMFTSKCVEMLTTAHGLLKQNNKINEDGLSEIFATNIFGHFILLTELEDNLGLNSYSQKTQIIWTSSRNAKKSSFSIDDIQHKNGLEPYSSSKYAIDLISYQINQEWNHKGIYSHTLCPGFVMTNLANGILASWIWYFIVPFLLLFRIIVPSLTLNPDIACYSLFWLANADPVQLDPKTKHYTMTTLCGKAYVDQKIMQLDPDLSKKTWMELKIMSQYYKSHGQIQE